MKKFLALLAVGVLGVSVVAGCGNKQTTTENKPGAAQSTSNEGQGKEEAAAPGNSGFKEYPIGDEVEIEGMKIAAIYLQPVVMEPTQKAGLKPNQSDIHLEADISALENNPLGYGAGEFIHYLTIKYKLEHQETGKVTEGSFMPMNAGDGSHYGANVKMNGAGTYKLTYTIDSPEKQDFLIHTDKETGVPGTFWKKPIELSWEFPFVPRKW